MGKLDRGIKYDFKVFSIVAGNINVMDGDRNHISRNDLGLEMINVNMLIWWNLISSKYYSEMGFHWSWALWHWADYVNSMALLILKKELYLLYRIAMMIEWEHMY